MYVSLYILYMCEHGPWDGARPFTRQPLFQESYYDNKKCDIARCPDKGGLSVYIYIYTYGMYVSLVPWVPCAMGKCKTGSMRSKVTHSWLINKKFGEIVTSIDYHSVTSKIMKALKCKHSA